MYKKYIKRFFDILISLILLVILSPLILIIALMVRIWLGKRVIFSQDRPGKDGKVFTLYKFRTMTDECDINGVLLPDEQRLTRFGKALRATSLDELPELFNILKGDMSMVGPRPLLVKYLPLYTPEQKRRHDVHPGLTGLAQVNGRNSLSWEEKFSLDNEYVNTVSLLLDIKIVFITIFKVIKCDGINDKASETMTEFTGTGQTEKQYEAIANKNTT